MKAKTRRSRKRQQANLPVYIVAAVLLAVVVWLGYSIFQGSRGGAGGTGAKQWSEPPAMVIDPARRYTATLVTEKGDIVVDLFVPEETDEKKQEKGVTKVFDDVELKNTEDPEKLKKEKEEKEIKEKLLADNQVQSAISVIKGIRVYKDYNDRGAPAAQATPAAAESL